MKRIKLLAFSMLILIATHANARESDYMRMNLNGRIKNITQTEYNLDNMESFRKIRYDFNTAGNKTMELLTGKEGEILYKCTYQYDKIGNLISEAVTDNQVNANFSKKYKYSGKRISQITIHSNNILITTIVYHYSTAEQEKPDSLRIHYKDRDNSWELTTFKYDDLKNLVEEINDQSDGDFIKSVYKYEKNRKLEKRDYNFKGYLVHRAKYEYDDHGNVSKEVSGYTSSGGIDNIFEYLYTYDKTGNWIEQRELSNGKTFALSTRIIEYYK